MLEIDNSSTMPRNTYLSANCALLQANLYLAATPEKLTSGKCGVQLIEIHVSGNQWVSSEFSNLIEAASTISLANSRFQQGPGRWFKQTVRLSSLLGQGEDKGRRPRLTTLAQISSVCEEQGTQSPVWWSISHMGGIVMGLQ